MLIGIILLCVAIIEVVLGLRFIFIYQKSQAPIWYGLLMIAVAMYVGANGFGYLNYFISQLASERLAWTGAVLTAVFILPFSINYPLRKKSLSDVIPIVLWPIAVFIPLIIFSDKVTNHSGVVHFGSGYEIIRGEFFWALIFFFGVYWLIALYNLIVSYSKSDGIIRKNLMYIIIGIVCSLSVSAYFDIYIPIHRVQTIGYLGSLFTSVWLGCTSYILIRA